MSSATLYKGSSLNVENAVEFVRISCRIIHGAFNFEVSALCAWVILTALYCLQG
jgi:hypothetical protein